MIDPLLTTTVRVDQLPPATPLLTDILPFETLSDSALKKATFQDLVDFININSGAFQFEVKTLLVNQQYITDNFELTGVGKNLCLGWRIADELKGLVTIGQGVGYPVGSFGGSKDAVVVEHEHFNGIADDNGDMFVYQEVATEMPGLATRSVQGENTARTWQGKTSLVGQSGTNKNMQPYLVALKIIKL
jgi:hypothetical protein